MEETKLRWTSCSQRTSLTTAPSPASRPDARGTSISSICFAAPSLTFRVTSEDIFSEGDKVAYRWTGRGTHQGELLGIAPSGNEVTFRGIDVLRIAGGKVVERWSEYNALEAMQRMGVIPGPEQEGVEPSH